MDASPLTTYRETQVPPLSQQQLADRLGVARETVARWESGTRKIDNDLLPIVAEKTGISKDLLRPDLAQLMRPATEAAE